MDGEKRTHKADMSTFNLWELYLDRCSVNSMR